MKSEGEEEEQGRGKRVRGEVEFPQGGGAMLVTCNPSPVSLGVTRLKFGLVIFWNN